MSRAERIRIIGDVRQLRRVLSTAAPRPPSAADAERYVHTYNHALRCAYDLGLATEVAPLASIPKWKLRSSASAAAAVHEKVNETLYSSERLLSALTLRSFRGRPERPATQRAAVKRVTSLCDRFHAVALEYRRPRARAARIVQNENDVHWLFRMMLAIDFDDVRPEEWTPSYAGRSSRMDLLVMPYGIVIETKMTRDTFCDAAVSEQLIVDIAKYRQSKDCRYLFCFVYDPRGHIRNARRLERDLRRLASPELPVRVAVRP